MHSLRLMVLPPESAGSFCGGRRLSLGTRAFRAFIPVNAALITTIQNLNRHRPAEIGPGPVNEGFDSFPDPGHQQGMYTQPSGESDGAIEFMPLLADRR